MIRVACLSAVAFLGAPPAPDDHIADAVPVASVISDAPKPSFIFILIDDLGWKDLGCYGNEFYETPRVDTLAQQGMRFTQGYAAGNVCSPTRASILTGKYPARLHLTNWIPKRKEAKPGEPDWTRHLRLEETTLAEALKSAGYVSACIGKWHVGWSEDHSPQRQGFADLPSTSCRPGTPDEKTDWITDDAEDFLEANKDKPFFLYLAYHAVHTPISADADVVAKYKSKAKPGNRPKNPTYAAMIEHLDSSVGRILDRLEALQIADRTVIIFFSDNGGVINFTSNAPLRAGKGSAYEGGVRVPLIVRWPGVVKPGSVCEEPVISTDFFPTLLEMAGVSRDLQCEWDGVSLVPLLKGSGNFQRDAVYWHSPHYRSRGRTPYGGAPYGAVRQGDYKLIEFYEDGPLELYNLKEDISESVNLAERMPARCAALRKELTEWRKSVGAQMLAADSAFQRGPRRQPSRPTVGDSSVPTTQPTDR